MPRKAGVEYDVTDHGGDTFVIVSNEDALNSKVRA
jgi:protease II